jgi:GAF domain-containing protein
MEKINKRLEAERIVALRRYDILDTPPEERFDRIARLAARGTGSPFAFITFVDSGRIWMKSMYGTDAVRERSREPGFCDKTICSDYCHIVEDARKDPETRNNSWVTGSLGIGAYAGVPLRDKSGYSLGAICVMGPEPRSFSESDILLLSDLKSLLMELLEGNRLIRPAAIGQQEEILRKLAHDIRNPLTIISLQAQILKMEPGLSAETTEALDQIKNAGKKIEAVIYSLLSPVEGV